MLGNLGGTNEANFSKTPSYSLSISRGSFSIGFSWSILSICVGMKSWWPSEAVTDEHKTLLMVFKLLFKGTLQKCMEYLKQIRRNVSKCCAHLWCFIQTSFRKLHFASHFVANFAPSIFSFSSSHSRKHLCFHPSQVSDTETPVKLGLKTQEFPQKPHHFQGPETAERSTLPIRRRSESSEIPHSHKPHMRSQGRRQWYLYQLNTVALHLFSLFRIASWHSCSTPQSHYRFWLTLYTLDISN